MKGSRNSTSVILLTLSFLFVFIYNFKDIRAVPIRHLCRPEQRDALLEFKNEFETGETCSKCLMIGSHRLASWTKNSDCCNWEGIKCKVKSGKVLMELFLGCHCLYGQFHSNSSLQNLHFLYSLDLSNNFFSGQIPSSIGNLSQLIFLDFSSNNFVGPIPSSIGNLSHLIGLYLSENQFVDQIPSSLGNLKKLTTLQVDFNKLSGEIPTELLNLTYMEDLYLNDNHLIGRLPTNNVFDETLPSSFFAFPSLHSILLQNNQLSGTLEFGNISLPSNLVHLRLGNNNFRGPIPNLISKLTELEFLDLSHLNVQGPVDFRIFSHIKYLYNLFLSNLNTTTTIELNGFLSHFKWLALLDLSGNLVSVTNKSSISDPLPQWINQVNLSNCGIAELPQFLRTQRLLRSLDVSSNQIKGQVPHWLWMLPDLVHVNLSNNTLTGFEDSTKFGPSFVPKSFIIKYLFGSNNNFMGEIPPFICALPSLSTLDLSNNNFNGSIPRCLRNLNRTLSVLNLRQNRLHGGLPKNVFTILRSLDVGHNQLVGKLPRSLIHFSALEVLNVESNRINDTFPFWLSSLQKLQILVLRSNAFHGPIHQASFPKLQIIDISHNHFTGTLSSNYFVKWNAMSSLGTNQSDEKYTGEESGYYEDSMVLVNKGIEMEVIRILHIYRALDFSGNKLKGEIPRSISLLKELHVLNLSSNAFTGHIPSSMGNLTALESLDVSQNHLSGRIPQELGSLSFLSYMNFSHNQLSGLVPGGTQFRTQNCSSFKYNLRLYGPSLDEVCKDINKPTSEHSDSEEEDEDEEVISWIAVVVGFISGIAFGITLGYILFRSQKPKDHNSIAVSRAYLKKS